MRFVLGRRVLEVLFLRGVNLEKKIVLPSTSALSEVEEGEEEDLNFPQFFNGLTL